MIDIVQKETTKCFGDDGGSDDDGRRTGNGAQRANSAQAWDSSLKTLCVY